MKGERPTTAEVMAVYNSPGELDLIRLDLAINFSWGTQPYSNVRPLNYVRKDYTCKGPRVGDTVTAVWRGDQLFFQAHFEAETTNCQGGSFGEGGTFLLRGGENRIVFPPPPPPTTTPPLNASAPVDGASA